MFYVNERNSLRNTSNTKDHMSDHIDFQNYTKKRVKTTIRSGAFVTNFEVFGNVVTLS